MADDPIPPERRVVTRAEAKAQGLRFFWTGKPCINGHVALRYTASNTCVICSRAMAKRGQRRKVQGVQPKRIVAAQQEPEAAPSPPVITRKRAMAEGLAFYFTGKPCRNGHVSQRKTLSRKCLGCIALYAWRAVPRNIRQAERREKRRARDREYLRAWRQKNREKARAHEHAYRARKAEAEGRITADDIKAVGEAQRWRCAYCPAGLRKGGYHVDHIVPLSKGGTNERRNIALACAPCNVSKKDRDPLEFARRRGRLL